MSNGVLIFKYMSAEDLLQLKEKMQDDLNFRIYLLCHKLYNLECVYEIFKNIDIDLSRITFVVAGIEKSPSDTIFYKKQVQQFILEANYNEIIYTKTYNEKLEGKATENKFNLFFIVEFLKFLLAPVYFLKINLEKLKINQFVWLLRIFELVSFFLFLINFSKLKILAISQKLAIKIYYLGRHLLLMSGFKSFGVFVDMYFFVKRTLLKLHNLLRVIVIKLFYLIRHLFLMSGFKSFGIFVDTYYFIRHILLMSVFKTYGFAIDCFYFIRHIVLVSVSKTYGVFVDAYYLIRLFCIRLFYKNRHFILMLFYKSYGFCVDSYYFIIRRYLFIARIYFFIKDKLLFIYNTIFRRYIFFVFIK